VFVPQNAPLKISGQKAKEILRGKRISVKLDKRSVL